MPTLDTQNNVAHMNHYDILAFEDDDDDSILEDTERNTGGACDLDIDPTITTAFLKLKPISQPSIPDLFIVKFDAQQLSDDVIVRKVKPTSQNLNEQKNKPTFATTTTDTFSLASISTSISIARTYIDSQTSTNTMTSAIVSAAKMEGTMKLHDLMGWLEINISPNNNEVCMIHIGLQIFGISCYVGSIVEALIDCNSILMKLHDIKGWIKDAVIGIGALMDTFCTWFASHPLDSAPPESHGIPK